MPIPKAFLTERAFWILLVVSLCIILIQGLVLSNNPPRVVYIEHGECVIGEVRMVDGNIWFCAQENEWKAEP